MLLTPEYPGGLFGEPIGSLRPLAPRSTSGGTPIAPPLAPQGDEASAPGSEPSLLPPPPPAPLIQVPVSLVPPRATTLVLSKAAKVVVWTFIMIGVVGNIGRFTVFRPEASRQTAIAASNRSYQTLAAASRKHQSSLSGCAVARNVACVQAADAEFGEAFSAFDRELGKIRFPDSAKDELRVVRSDVQQLAATLNQLATAPAAEFQRLRVSVAGLLTQSDDDFRRLGSALGAKV